METLSESLSVYYPTDEDLNCRDWRNIDTFCPDGLASLTEQVARRMLPGVILTQFVFLTKCLEIDCLVPAVKLVDADNIFTGRAAMYREQGIPYDWFSTDAAQERHGLLRADVILAIQKREAECLSRLVPERPVVLVPHIEEVFPRRAEHGQGLLYVGAANPENALGLARFLDEVWPTVLRRHAGARVRVAGRVCQLINRSLDGVEFMGLVEDLGSLYDKTAIVLNPAPVGSGIKIKSVQAICRGRCLVTTGFGAQGLEHAPSIYCNAETSDDFVAGICSLLDHPIRISEIGRRAHEFALSYFSPDVVLKRLEEAIARSFERRVFLPADNTDPNPVGARGKIVGGRGQRNGLPDACRPTSNATSTRRS
jgi:hypothetical protein